MLSCNLPQLLNDLMDIVRIFDGAQDLQIDLCVLQTQKATQVSVQLFEKVENYFYPTIATQNQIELKRLNKRYAKQALYLSLSNYFNKSLPWGSLTGIRPVKLAYQLIDEGVNYVTEFENFFKVTSGKTKIVGDIINMQKNARQVICQGGQFLFVNIPFCPSRCNYCSFLSAVVRENDSVLDSYVDVLIKEIKQAKTLITNLKGAYIGGGTPIFLNDKLLSLVLEACDVSGVEFTVEAGRPELITKANLEIMKKHNVSRICINPQSFNDQTLAAIGRTHTAKQVISAYELAKSYNFDVNMDLIANLSGETPQMFYKSIDTAMQLAPNNITVHTLALKKGSILKENLKQINDANISKMLAYAQEKLYLSNYLPYYLYRQKYSAGNHENIGYAKPNCECVYNIAVMEELSDVVACGANAISKRVFSLQNRIERLKNPKDIKTYFEKIDSILADKKAFFSSK